MRILPRLNEDVNEEWLSDKGRFQYDGLKQQRLNVPLVKGPDGAFAPKRWPEALDAVAQGLQGVAGNEMKAIAGKLSDAESMVALKVHKALQWSDVQIPLGSISIHCKLLGLCRLVHQA